MIGLFFRNSEAVLPCRRGSYVAIRSVPMVIVDKRREKANISEVMNIIGDVSGKDVILLDDMIDTVGSICGAAEALIEVGKARSVTACASHGVLSDTAVERIEKSYLNEVVFLNTIPRINFDCKKN